MKSMIKNALTLTLLMSVPAIFAAESLQWADLGNELAAETAAAAASSEALARTAGNFEPSSRSGLRAMHVRAAQEAQMPYDMAADHDSQMFAEARNFSEAAGEFPQPVVVAAPVRRFDGLRTRASNAWNKLSIANMKSGVTSMKNSAVAYYNNTTKTEKAIDTGKVAAKAGVVALVAYGTYKGGKHLYNKYVKSTPKSTTPALAQSAPVVQQPVVQQAVEAVKAAPANIKRVAKKAVKHVKKAAKRGKKAVKRSARNVRRKIAGRRSAKLVVARRSR